MDDKHLSCDTYHCQHGAGPFFGRLLLSIIFILAALGKIFDFEGGVNLLRQMGVQGAPVFFTIGLLMELIGGLMILFGWHTRLGVYILMIYLIPVTLMIHNFWGYEGADMAIQLQLFLKNLAIYGGLLLLLSYGPGRWSLDAKREQWDHYHYKH